MKPLPRWPPNGSNCLKAEMVYAELEFREVFKHLSAAVQRSLIRKIISGCFSAGRNRPGRAFQFEQARNCLTRAKWHSLSVLLNDTSSWCGWRMTKSVFMRDRSPPCNCLRRIGPAIAGEMPLPTARQAQFNWLVVGSSQGWKR